jgi:hypothetical protein
VTTDELAGWRLDCWLSLLEGLVGEGASLGAEARGNLTGASQCLKRLTTTDDPPAATRQDLEATTRWLCLAAGGWQRLLRDGSISEESRRQWLARIEALLASAR